MRRSRLDRFLRLFTDVRAGEGPRALRLLGAVFLILAAYYFIKPAREGLLATSGIPELSDLELKAYSSFGQGLILLAVIPLHDRIAGLLSRRALITRIPLFFVSNLILFWALQPGLVFEAVPLVGVVFYLWVGIFNVFIVAQFWGFAADLYSDDAGRRLFPLIAIGATAGAAAGAGLSERLVDAEILDTYSLLLVAAGALALAVAFLRAAEGNAESDADDDRAERDASGGMGLVLRHRYLLAAALLVLVLNWVNTNGENLLFSAVQKHLEAQAAAQGLGGEALKDFLREQTTAFYGDFFFWVNVVALFLQAFVASRILRYGGFGVLLLCLPVVSLLSYSTMAVLPLLSVIRWMKVAENSTDYSIHNTAKQVIWLPTTTEMKYKAKAAVDTFFVRIGDGMAALTAFVGTNLLALPLRGFFLVNAVLALVWLAVGVVVVREHHRFRTRRRTRKA